MSQQQQQTTTSSSTMKTSMSRVESTQQVIQQQLQGQQQPTQQHFVQQHQQQRHVVQQQVSGQPQVVGQPQPQIQQQQQQQQIQQQQQQIFQQQQLQQQQQVQQQQHLQQQRQMQQNRFQSQTTQQRFGMQQGGSPPVFEQIFRNARFAQGGQAIFEGKIRGVPKPTVRWIRKGQPLPPSAKHQMGYDELTGRVILQINGIGTGDEGEYTCEAKNQFGEALCTVFIQPEAQVPLELQQRVQQEEAQYRQQQQLLLQQQALQQQQINQYNYNQLIEIQRQKQLQQQQIHMQEAVVRQEEEKVVQVQQQQQQQQQRQPFRQIQPTAAQQNGLLTSSMTMDQDFKVDTFEYRILHEVEYRQIITKRGQEESDSKLTQLTGRPAAPLQVISKPRNSKLLEGSNAMFQVKFTSGQPPPRASWFRNGVRLVNSNRIQVTTTPNSSTLELRLVLPDDTGHYTVLLENQAGCLVSSAYLAVENSEQPEQVVSEKSLAPTFLKVPDDTEIQEGKQVRIECRVGGRPFPEVFWFINGVLVRDDNSHKIIVNEVGNHALLITCASKADGGLLSCVARNTSGEAKFEIKMNIIERESVMAPKFVERFTTSTFKDGEPVTLFARAVGNPVPKITWQKDGLPFAESENCIIITQNGASRLDITGGSPSDAGWYQVTAQNAAGSTATRARVFIEREPEYRSEPWKLTLPKPTKVIEPEKPLSPEIIYLRHVERTRSHVVRTEEERTYDPPVFLTPLKDVSTIEGGRAHFEAKVHPVGDPTMKVDWYFNGKTLSASSRSNVTYRFGFIALDLISLIAEDGGIFTCVVSSASGSAESSATLDVKARSSIEQRSVVPQSWSKIQEIEDYSRYTRKESIEEKWEKPHFTKDLLNLGEVSEGKNAHFEGSIRPTNDPHTRVEWFHNGKPLTASSRITTIFNFGYVSLNITHVRVEDSGVYTCRAYNRAGEAISSSSIQVNAAKSVTSNLGIPEQEKYIQSVEELEAYSQMNQMRYMEELVEPSAPPEFKTPIRDQLGVREAGFAHFEARLEPINDSKMRVEWYKDGKLVEASSRITSFYNFGYVALTIKQVTSLDSGTYTCRAVNLQGSASTSAKLTITSNESILMDSKHTESLQKIQYLEDTTKYARKTEETEERIKPKFLIALKGTTKIKEHQRAHFETRLEPQNDSSLIVTWFKDGQPLMSANRIQLYHDFGYVAIDIKEVREEDSGEYTVHARNAAGEDYQSCNMVVHTIKSIDTAAMHKIVEKKVEHKQVTEEFYPKSKPQFVQHLSQIGDVLEHKSIHFEARLEPMGDPSMRVEWYKDGRPLTIGTRFRTYFDFGYVALDISQATSQDTGEYTIVATNSLGFDQSSSVLRIISRSTIDTNTLNESSLEMIQYLEDESRYKRTTEEGEEFERKPPVFIRPLKNHQTIELSNVHLECRLNPVGDPSMKVEWFVNGKPITVGHRFRPAYEFDYVALDILSPYTSDSGVYSAVAKNSMGEAVTSCTLKIISRKDAEMGLNAQTSMNKFDYLEDSSRFKREEQILEEYNVKPKFISCPKNVNIRESQLAHFECKLEPVNDPYLKVEWYKDGVPMQCMSRSRLIHDFGYVAMDINNAIAEDSGVYTAVATNLCGMDQVQCELVCKSGKSIITHKQVETSGIEKLEKTGKRGSKREYIEEDVTTQAPVFTTSLKNIELREGQRAHFESRLVPVSDPTMRIQWFQNGVQLKSGSRFTETLSFGYVALDIMQVTNEDIGDYTCIAVNALGEAMTSGHLQVLSLGKISNETLNESSLAQIQYLESRHAHRVTQEESVLQPPLFTQPLKDVTKHEGQPVHFEARLIPVGDSNLKVEWFRNGVPIEASNRISSIHDFGFVSLDMNYSKIMDSGTYTCVATNALGQAVTSSKLIILSKSEIINENEQSLQKIRMLEDASKYGRREEEEIEYRVPPKFVTQLHGKTDLLEQTSSHYECRVEPRGDPHLKLNWYKDGKELTIGHRFKPMFDFGFAAIDILDLVPEDTGEYVCIATNKHGKDTTRINIEVRSRAALQLDTQHEDSLSKIRTLEQPVKKQRIEAEPALQKPEFIRPLKNANARENEKVHLEATVIPVNDADLKIDWFKEGKLLPQGHRFKTIHDFGFVALDLLYAYPEDSGIYSCRAKNKVGEAITTCAVKIEGKAGLELGTLDAERLAKIKQLEAYEHAKPTEPEPEPQKPVFTSPLKSLENLKESDHAHLECNLIPINDPNLKVEWFVNGVNLKSGHRFKTTHDFGYVALDILYAYPEDSGVYTAVARNLVGEASNTCKINVKEKSSLFLDSQHPEGLAKIKSLETPRPGKLEVEETPITAPVFTSKLIGTTVVKETHASHFECKVEPVRDPNLKVIWFKNGKLLQDSSRIHKTFDFGYAALDIQKCIKDDEGDYMAFAKNSVGEAENHINLQVICEGSILSDSIKPEGLDKIRALEEKTPYRPEEIVPSFQRPVFTVPLQNIDGIAEAQNAHFEGRLIPVGDPKLKVEWFRNEKPLEDSSRIKKTHDFGYVALDIQHVRADDAGVYLARATNDHGEATTTAKMTIQYPGSPVSAECQHPEGLKKIQQLEQKPEAKPEDIEMPFEKPMFTATLTGPAELWEGEHAHFECKVVPVGDPNLKYEWFLNGIELKMGSRFRTTTDFGFVTLDILSTVEADTGMYSCKVKNYAGEAITQTPMRVKPRPLSNVPMHPEAWAKLQDMENAPKPIHLEPVEKEEPPVFTKNLTSYDNLKENTKLHLDAFVEPKHDPHLKVEWFHNGLPLDTGTRIKTTFDFGFVTLDIDGVRERDNGLYVARATNRVGEAVSTCSIKVQGHPTLDVAPIRPEALPRIQTLEAPVAQTQQPPEKIYSSPLFITNLNNVDLMEGETGHFHCNVEPKDDPDMKIEWFRNNHPLPTASRFKTVYEFGFISLDIQHCYPEDEGLYTVRATNKSGSVSTSGTLKCRSLPPATGTMHPKGVQGLDAIQAAEQALAGKSERRPSLPPPTFAKPYWKPGLVNELKLIENERMHLEAQAEPKEDPDLKIEWFFCGKPFEHGARAKSMFDFGFVTLDLEDVFRRDEGLYTCRCWNKYGEAFTSCTTYITDKEGLILATQHPKGEKGLDKIKELDAALKPKEKEEVPFKGIPPKFTTQFTNLENLIEGELAHFEACLIPVGDPKMRVEWEHEGKIMEAGARIRTVYAFGMVVMEIQDVKMEDSGEYKCRAINDYGQDEISLKLRCIEFQKGQPPRFTRQLQSLEGLRDGDSAHMEATLIPVGDPDMVVEWFHNGVPLPQSARCKTIYDFGYVVLDLASVGEQDIGEYICKARNKYGKDQTKAFLNCIGGHRGVDYDILQPDAYARILELEGFGKEKPELTTPYKLQPPVFTEHFEDRLDLQEGQSCHFEARLIPIDDPALEVAWYKDGIRLRSGHKFRTFHDFGIVILDVLYTYEEDSGVYECRAWNKLGKDTTRATLKCKSKASLIFDPQVPKRMMGGLDKIQTIEDNMRRTRKEKEEVKIARAPVFTVPLSNVEGVREGENAHFEARLEPANDPRLKVEWFWNGKPLKIGSRFKTFHDFGFAILELTSVYEEDSGIYECRATNEYGEAVTSCKFSCSGKRNLILESQLPSGASTIQKIAELEGLGREKADVKSPEDIGQSPTLTELKDLELGENSLAHFECRLGPTNDESMVVEFFHNGRVLSQGSRTKVINDFGFVILEVSGITARDAGIYTIKATNRHGESSVTASLKVKAHSTIISEPQLPSQFKSGTQSIQNLEDSLYKREEKFVEEEMSNPPKFLKELEDIEVVEGAAAHFDTRVEPTNDSSMRIEWYFNGKPLLSGSRVHHSDDFGFVSLDLDWTFGRDSGEYICRAVNKWGFATTRAKLICKSKRNIIMDSQLPSAALNAERLSELERGPVKSGPTPDEAIFAPKFITQIKSLGLGEGEPAHFECRVEPKNDSRLTVEWFKDGKPLNQGSRFKSIYEFGFVSLDISYTKPEDTGEYVCIARNEVGMDKTVATVTIKQLPNIILGNQLPKGMKKSETLIQMEAAIKKYTSEVFLTEDDIYDNDKRQPPRFVTQIESKEDLSEMESSKFECQLAPVGDPNMKVEWFKDGVPLHHKNRFTPIYDFGYVAMNFAWVYPEDSGTYVCRATNLYGSDETTAVIRTRGKPGIVYESQLPKGMQSVERIREMESSWLLKPDTKLDDERKREAPVFVTKPEEVTVYEGDWARFVCRVIGWPRPRVLWIVNGKTVMNGTRYKLTYDGMWQLDIPKTRQYDHGKVEVLAKNVLGEAYSSTTLTVRNKHEDYRGVLKNSPRPWYEDSEGLRSYQEDGIEKVNLQSIEKGGTLREEKRDLEWQEKAKKKSEDYYNRLKELEESQVTKEQKLRQHKQLLAQPNLQTSAIDERVISADEGKVAIEKHAANVTKKEVSSVFNKAQLEALEKYKKERLEEVKLKRVREDAAPEQLEPRESSEYGKEITSSTSKQTQKEQKGDLEITRKITATETTEKEHKGKTEEKVVQGKVLPSKPPYFTKKITPCRALEKQQGKFEVEFDGDPLPTIAWFREDFPIQNSADFQIHTFSTKSILVIREVFMEDSGVFSAVAENRGGKAKCSANLVVEKKKGAAAGGPPNFLQTIEDIKVRVGDTLRVDAKIGGLKPIDVYWLKDGTKLAPSKRVKLSKSQDTYSLTITDTTPEDGGKIECVAMNSVGEARCEAEAEVVSPIPKSSPKTPEEIKNVENVSVTQPLENVVVKEGQPAMFKCRVSGKPVPTATWTKGPKVLKPSKFFKITQDGNLHILKINQSFPEDEGEYKITVKNNTGSAVSTASLKVTRPESEEKAPTLSQMQDITVWEDEPAQFKVQCTGNPLPSVQWFREGALIPASEDFAIFQEGQYAVLLIKSTYEEDEGQFSIRATNPAGQAESSARLTVKSKDD